MNTCIRKHTDNCCRCSSADNWPCLAPALLLLTLKHMHTHTQETKCPFQQRRGGDGVRPRPPKSQTKVHPCCRGQNLPFCQPSGLMPRSTSILELNNWRPNTRDICQPRAGGGANLPNGAGPVTTYSDGFLCLQW